MKRLGLLAALMALLISIPVMAQETSAPELFSSVVIPCPEYPELPGSPLFAQFGDVQGETYECGVVYVPENYDAPDGRVLELFYIRLKAMTETPMADPVVYLSGGPGGAASREVMAGAVLMGNLAAIRQNRDVVVFDQRGTGFSDYLSCAPYASTVGVMLERTDDPAMDELVASVLSSDAAQWLVNNGVCAILTDGLTDIDMSQYNTATTVRDMASLMESLGYDQYNLVGTSYGTRVAQFAMRLIPDHIRSTILDGSVSLSISNVASTGSKRAEQYVNLFALCAADEACNAAYPNLTQDFQTLLETLEANPIVLDAPLVLHPAYAFGGNLPAVMTEISPEYFTQVAGFANNAQEGGIAYAMPRIITDLLQGNTDSFEFFMTFGVDTPMPEPPVGAANTSPSLSVQPSFEAPLSVLLGFAAIANAGTDIGSQWAGTVVSDLNARLQAGEAQDVLVEALVRMALLPTNGTDPQALTDYATTYLSPEAAQAANALVGVMTDNDVRALMWRLQKIGFDLSVSREDRSISGFLQNIVNCADDMKWSSFEEAVALQEASPFPQIQSLPYETTEAFFGICNFIPTTTTEEVSQPLVSDIPTLILTGLLDIQTPKPWGRQVAENLSNVQLVDFESLGHVTFGQTGDLCAGIVADSYFSDPTAAPDTTCVAAYDLKPFVLPTAEIPQ